jgi:hypothetical protein
MDQLDRVTEPGDWYAVRRAALGDLVPVVGRGPRADPSRKANCRRECLKSRQMVWAVVP